MDKSYLKSVTCTFPILSDPYLYCSYGTAYAETLTIAHYPYYTFVDRDKMYTVGSLFYGGTSP
jgi:hypothetical protein